MQVFYYNYGGPGTMRNPRKSIDEQYALVIECRSSGLSDQQWCMQHDIKPGTFIKDWMLMSADTNGHATETKSKPSPGDSSTG